MRLKENAWPFICYLLGCPFTLVEDANEQITWWYLVLQPVVCSRFPTHRGGGRQGRMAPVTWYVLRFGL